MVLCPLSQENTECKHFNELMKRLGKGELYLHTLCKECRKKENEK